MMRDQLGRHLIEIRRVLDDPAEALGGGAGGRVSESGGVALDVVGGSKQLLAGEVRKTALRIAVCAAESRSVSIPIQFLNSPDRPASAFSARATGSSRSFSATRRNTLRKGLGCVIT
jgi:hypothetical protein